MNKSNDDTLVKPVISNLPVAIIVVDRDRRVMLSNKAAELISGKTEGEMFNLRGGDVLGCVYADASKEGCGYSKICEGCKIRNAVLEAFEKKTNNTSLETKLVLQEFGERDLKVSATYINIDTIKQEIIEEERRKRVGRRISDKTKELVIVSVEDVTEFKKKERLAAAMETIGAACHELNNPLQSVTGNIDLMRMELNDKDFDKDSINRMIDKIDTASKRIGDIVSKLINLKVYETKKYLNSEILDVEKSTKIE